ncbi:hypothetical protein D9M71_757060 [compost metagenome]
MVSELRAQIVGHELDDEHHATYSRDFTVKEKLDGLGAHSPGLRTLGYRLNLETLRPLVDPALLPEGSRPTKRHKARSNA